MSSLALRNIHKTYGKSNLETLKGIDIEIDAGEFLILVGPSGCGKSTLMNLIAGLEEVSAGAIEIDGVDVTKVPPKDRDIAMVFQSYALYPNMTVRDNIAFGLEIRKVAKEQIDREVERVAKLLQIDTLLKRKPAQLSGGQQQRVAMGRALARHPKIYLFDEPLSNLDAKLRIEMRTEVKKLHQRLDATIVYVTHDQIEAMTLADRIAVMKDGELHQLGAPKEIYDNPANRFVAGFIGSPPMNFIPIQVQQDGDGRHAALSDESGETTRLPLSAQLPVEPGQTLLLGLRPEQITHMQPHKQQQPDVFSSCFEALVTEPTGPDTIVLIKANGVEINCRVDPDHPVRAGERLALMFDLSKAVFFDPDSGERIREA